MLGAVPPNVLVRPRVPQLPLLERVDAVVCHAGHNTVCETLWHGLPLVVAPIRDDQPIVAAQVVAAGAGVRLRFGRADAARVAAAVEEVLTEASYRRAAERLSTSFRAAGGSPAAAGHLEQLALESLAHLRP
jgi:UDP:flavonoid glycosyltransferase YjiC (YdhE family)